jgi:NADH-quinone oxidoreductase subunit A
MGAGSERARRYAVTREVGLDYVPVILLFGLAVLFVAGGIVTSALLGGRARNRTQLEPYECGVSKLERTQRSFSVKFYLIAILFILFDLEAVYLYPWAALYRDLKVFGLVEMGVFIAILVVGYAYAWKRGALQWD